MQGMLSLETVEKRIAYLKEYKKSSKEDEALLILQIRTLNGVRELIKKRDLLWEKNQQRKR